MNNLKTLKGRAACRASGFSTKKPSTAANSRTSVWKSAIALIPVALFIAFIPGASWACACGCGVFDVGTNAMFPTGEGGTVSLEYDFMNQNKNWSGNSSAPGEDNEDKQIRTHFLTAGLQYMFDRTWGVDIKVPFLKRRFTTEEDGSNTFSHTALGDIRLTGIYTGFSPDLSTGLELGVKLPTGSYTLNGFDRDTAIGSGSTDLLVGAFHRGRFSEDQPYTWVVQGKLDQPVLTQDGYRPGSEINMSAGVAHDPVALGSGIRVAPILQLINTYRFSDSGFNANSSDTGYERVIISPGVEFSFGSTRLNANVGLPVFQHVRGNQLVAPVLVRVLVSYEF